MKIPLLPNGSALILAEEGGALGGKVWPAAFSLCQQIKSMSETTDCLSLSTTKTPPPSTTKTSSSWRRRRQSQILELGSGTGAVGIYAAACFQVPTILTEHKPPLVSVLPSVPYSVDGSLDYDFLESSQGRSNKSDKLLNLLRRNVASNESLFRSATPAALQSPEKSKHAQVMELDWNNVTQVEQIAAESVDGRGFDLILASDVTYFTQLHEPLAAAIARLLLRDYTLYPQQQSSAQTTTTIIIAATEETSSDEERFAPKCLVAHQERIINLRGDDSQLLTFERALEKVALAITKKIQYQVNDDDCDKSATPCKVSILEIQHAKKNGHGMVD